ncbi:phosphatase PAP2 family protein [Halioxenophilus sp. WMMB6]|uniref:phosphatase PAP2 family protein n=1 Tax=Halioxenophilus sp. WMMB6 TaxID=3073815 RepID=UPI00295F43A6|nr:phosphatase PAP2 family protein [Halioxenophilus sp. WMMB6]
MSNTTHQLSTVDSYFLARTAVWRQTSRDDPWLLWLALLFASVGTAIVTTTNQHTLFLAGNHWAHQLLPDAAWANITLFGDAMVAFTLGLLFCFRFPNLALAVLVAGLFGGLVLQIAKHLLEIPRPPNVLDRELFHIIGPAFRRNSMPSGHTTTIFMLAALLWRCVPATWVRLLLIALAALVAFSRVAVGVHWPADLCFGAAMGLSAAWLGLKVTDRVALNKLTYWVVCAIQFAVAVNLFNFTGGFEQTALTAKTLSLMAILYWLLSWGLFLLAPRWVTRVESAKGNT